jgi:O-antigen/teichoic acid export membrane protein
MKTHSLGNALFYSFLGKYLNIGAQLVTTMIVARLILPEQFGLFALGFIFISLASIIKEFGVGGYIIKENNLTPELIQSAYGLLLLIAASVGCIILLLAKPLAIFFEQDELQSIIMLLTINIFISPFGAIVAKLLDKAMNFRPTMITGVISNLISSILTVVLALNDFGVYALVYGSISQAILQAFLLQFYRPKNLPLAPSLKHAKEITGYSLIVSANSVVGLVGHHASELVTGKYFSMADLGILSRAITVAGLFNKLFSEALNPVLSPLFSAQNHKGAPVTDILKDITILQLAIAWPFYGMLGVLSYEVIFHMYGPNWITAAVYLQWYCFSTAIYFMTQMFSPLLFGLGIAKPITKANLLLEVVRISICLISVNFGILYMVIALATILPVARLVIMLKLIKGSLNLETSTFFSWMKKPLIILVLSLFPAFIVKSIGLDLDGYFNTNLMILCLVSVFVWLFSLKLLSIDKIFFKIKSLS